MYFQKLGPTLKNFFHLFFNTALNTPIQLLIVYIASSYVGASEFGNFSYNQSFIIFLVPLISFGVIEISSRNLSVHEERKEKILASYTVIYLIGTLLLLCLLIVFLYFNFFGLEHDKLLLLIFLLYLFHDFGRLPQAYFESISKNIYFVRANITANALFLLCIIVFTYIGFFNIYIWAALLGVKSIIRFMLLIFSLMPRLRVKEFIPSQKIMKEAVQETWTAVFASMAVIFYLRVDAVFIQNYLTPQDTGIYSLASRFVEFLLFFSIILDKVFLPKFAKNGKNYFKENYPSAMALSYLASLILILIVFNISAPIENILDSSYIGIKEILNAYAFILIFQFINNTSSIYLKLKKKVHLYSFKIVIGALINFCLNFYFIPLYGIMGAVASTLISLFISVYVANLLFTETRELLRIQLTSFIRVFNFKKMKKILLN